ncbi:MAG: amidohydrolase [Clostridium sp.]|jgi:amidohydrolase
MINRVKVLGEKLKEELINLSECIFNNPELGDEEFKACAAHVDILKKYNFSVEEEYLGMKTAFKASFDSGKPGPTIAFLSEYDALPSTGHGCGHNILGATSTGAGIVLSQIIKELTGKVVVYGTPAEETNGAKVTMVNKGAFNDIDAVIEVHPADKHYVSGKTLAMEALQFTFTGKSAHAASAPHKGINALDAAINTFVSINALRQHIIPSARIHGIIVEGGNAANVIPALAIARFYVRATKKIYLQELVEKVKNCANGAALGTGAKLEITNYEFSFDNLVTNETLSQVYQKRILDMGVDKIYPPRDAGSSDTGNVSHVVPTIHPYFGISNVDITAHTKEFANASITPLAYESMIQALGASVLTAIDVLTDDELLRRIKDEFAQSEK